MLNAIGYVAEHGCKWRGLPKTFGHWHAVYTRANRWAKNGVLYRVLAALQDNDMTTLKIEEQLAKLQQMPHLVRSFFRAPSVAYITDC